MTERENWMLSLLILITQTESDDKSSADSDSDDESSADSENDPISPDYDDESMQDLEDRGVDNDISGYEESASDD